MIGNKRTVRKAAALYKEYKLNGGTMKWNEFRKTYKVVEEK